MKKILILFAILLIFALFIFRPFKNQPALQWEKYTHDQCGTYAAAEKIPFSINIPVSWKESVTDSIPAHITMSTDYTYKSPDFSFTVSCGTGFGGMCETPWQKFTADNRQFDGCLSSNKEQFSFIGGITSSRTPKDASYGHLGVYFGAYGKDNPQNQQLLNQILSSFKFL